MIFLDLGVVVCVFLFSAVKGEGLSVNSIANLCHYNVSITRPSTNEDLIEYISELTRVASEHLDHCESETPTIGNGYLYEKSEYFYTLKCDAHHTIPLGSLSVWSCRKEDPHAHESVPVNQPTRPGMTSKYGATECIDKMWPETVYIERGVFIHGSDACHGNREEDIALFGKSFYTKKNLIIQGLEFSMGLSPEKTECIVVFNTSNDIFLEWTISLKFQLVHKPKYKVIPDTVLDEANCQLGLFIEDMLNNYKTKGKRVMYDLLEEDPQFHPGPCNHPGSMVDEEFRSGFTHDIPLCRMCQRGFYLNIEKGVCLPCEKYSYSDVQGSTACKSCPNVHTNVHVGVGDSLFDCYEWAKESREKWTAFSHGLIFIIVFHLLYLVIVTWNVRWYIRLMLTRSKRQEDEYS